MRAFFEKKAVAAGMMVLAEFIWAMSYILSRKTLHGGDIPPMSLSFLRFTVAWLVMCAVPAPGPKPDRKDSVAIALMGVTGIALCIGLQNLALVYTSATNASILAGLIPVFTAMGAVLFFGERFRVVNLAGFVIAFAAGALIVWNGKVHFKLNPAGDLLMVLSSLSWAAYTIIGRDAVRKYSPSLVSRRTMFVGALCLLPFFLHELAAGKLAGTPPSVALVVLYLGVVVTAIEFTIWVYCVRVLGPVAASNMLYFQCVITMICAWIFIREPITILLLACTGAVIFGVFLGNLKEKMVEHPVESNSGVSP